MNVMPAASGNLPPDALPEIIQTIEFYAENTVPYGFDQAQVEESVEHLCARAFGPGRFARAAFRLREQRPCEAELSFTAWRDKILVGSVQQTKIIIGGKAALLLGPLVVSPDFKNVGIGAALMRLAVEASRAHGHQLIILVGDHPYYERFGFKIVPKGQITMPGPADPGRILYCQLCPGIIADYQGMAQRF